jgi:hypothetical protein
MNVEIGAEAAQFPEREYINGIAVAVYTSAARARKICSLYIYAVCNHQIRKGCNHSQEAFFGLRIRPYFKNAFLNSPSKAKETATFQKSNLMQLLI